MHFLSGQEPQHLLLIFPWAVFQQGLSHLTFDDLNLISKSQGHWRGKTAHCNFSVSSYLVKSKFCVIVRYINSDTRSAFPACNLSLGETIYLFIDSAKALNACHASIHSSCFLSRQCSKFRTCSFLFAQGSLRFLKNHHQCSCKWHCCTWCL